jgi:hypothetical protein
MRVHRVAAVHANGFGRKSSPFIVLLIMFIGKGLQLAMPTAVVPCRHNHEKMCASDPTSLRVCKRPTAV